MAQRTAESKQSAPHFYVTVEVDVEKIEALREFFKEEESGKVSINDFVVKACALALLQMTEVNATYQGDHVIQYGAVHVGVAVAVDDGLLVPVIKNAHAMSLRQIADASRSLVETARAGKLHPDEMSGSTFSISNMGMLDVDNFSAIINQPNAAIVAISTAKRRVVPVNDEEVEIRMVMNVTGSFDHRVVDGAIGARFMNVVRDYLQNPTRLLN
jgi:pyruvate dehydrogenase E2 component (dihydrolipoamide acetyltransferase)